MKSSLLLLLVLLLFTTVAAFDRSAGKKKTTIPKKKRKRRSSSSTSATTQTTKPAGSSTRTKATTKTTKATQTTQTTQTTQATTSTTQTTTTEDAQKSKTYVYDLEHATSADSDDFTSRGTIEVTISKRSKSVRVDSSNIRSSLTTEESKKLLELAKQQQFYRLRLPSLPGSSRKVVASIPACTLLTGNFQESLWLHLDLSGHLVAFDYITPTSMGECTKQALASGLKRHHTQQVKTSTTVQIAKAKNGHRVPNRILGQIPPPPGMQHLLKKTKAQEEASNQPGFLRKYWYIILPVAVMMLLPGGK